MRLGRALRHPPVAESAWLAGEVGEAQVAALSRARTPATEEAMATDEEMLVGEAIRLRFDSFIRALSYWSQHADPDGTEDDAASGPAARRFHLSQSFEGMWFGDLLLDPIAGAVVAKALERIVDELFEADWAEARASPGAEPTTADLARTPAQRRADAQASLDALSVAGRICELANGTVVSPGSLVDWLDEAWVERVVFDSPSRVIDVGVARRLFSGATRRAVQVRDRQCFHHLCDEAAEDCEIDHVEPWSAGGATVAANGRAACGHHNRRRHRRG